MSKLLHLAVGAALGFAASTPMYAADTSDTNARSAAWSDAQVRSAMEKCNNLTATARAKCIVNIRPAGGGGSSLAVAVGGSADENTVKHGAGTEEEYTAAVKKCESADAANRDRCIADVKEHFGRM
jgi:hypothetical protein